MTIAMVVNVLFAYSEVLHNSMLIRAAGLKGAHSASGLALSLGNAASVVALAFTAWAFALPGKVQLELGAGRAAVRPEPGDARAGAGGGDPGGRHPGPGGDPDLPVHARRAEDRACRRCARFGRGRGRPLGHAEDGAPLQAMR